MVAQQSIRPAEVDRPADIAEAWDSWDVRSLPNMSWGTVLAVPAGLARWTPGWSAQMPTISNSRAAFNGYRHGGPCNILYADGHVSADADEQVVPSVEWAGNTVMAGAKVYTWPRADSLWGHWDRLVGNTTFGTTWR
jgi:prepilin-type processing-associated H-X9-DG protein